MDKRPWYKKLFGPPKAAASDDNRPSIAERINWGGQYSDKKPKKSKKPKSGWQKPQK